MFTRPAVENFDRVLGQATVQHLTVQCNVKLAPFRVLVV